ncbi:hypothetical protein H4219_004018 [Mycoemilia scoparia]|uniref:Uncharacterized protein n=1 Tax=Mycoemilia scoparia TaxID=417184 RepID=A0A9W7ZT07_9FUNG|nr:hypothetical protein H4219_004018 [Mycoemilia scoparia]
MTTPLNQRLTRPPSGYLQYTSNCRNLRSHWRLVATKALYDDCSSASKGLCQAKAVLYNRPIRLSCLTSASNHKRAALQRLGYSSSMELDIRNVPMGSRAMAASVLNPSMAKHILESAYTSGRLVPDMSNKMSAQIEEALPSILEQYPCSYNNMQEDGLLQPRAIIHPSDLVSAKQEASNCVPFMCKDTTIYTGYGGIALLLLQIHMRKPDMVVRGPRYGRFGIILDPKVPRRQSEWLERGCYAHKIHWVDASVGYWCVWYLEDLLLSTSIPEPVVTTRSPHRGSLSQWHLPPSYYRQDIGFLGTSVGVWALAAAACKHIHNDHDMALVYSSFIRDIGSHFISELDPKEASGKGKPQAEILYGAAGWLYTVLFLRRHVGCIQTPLSGKSEWYSEVFELASNAGESSGRKSQPSLIVKMIEWIVSQGEKTALRQPLPVPENVWVWEWGGTAYVGAIHGIAGILTILNRFRYAREAYSQQIEATARFLGSLRSPNYNYPPDLSTRSCHLFHFCHGAPGICLSFLSIYHYTESPSLKKYCLKEAIRSLKTIEANGVLRKGVGLCHGLSGNAFPFIISALYQSILGYAESNAGKTTAPSFSGASMGRSGARSQVTPILGTALGLSSLCMYEKSLTKLAMLGVPDQPYSLFEGRAGAVWLWMVMSYDVLPKWTTKKCRLEVDSRDLDILLPLLGFPCYSDV